MKNVATPLTVTGMRLFGQIFIDVKKQEKELGGLQKGMAHWNGLLASKPETPPKGPFVQVP